MGSLLLSSGSWCAQDFVCVLQDWSLVFPQYCGIFTVISRWPSRQIPWRFPVPLSIPLVGKPDLGFRTFMTVGELLWYYCFPVYGSPTQWVSDLILSWLHPSYPLPAASLSLDMGYLFLIGFSVLLSMIVQQLVAVLVLLQEEMSTCPFTPPSWTRSLVAWYS